MIGRRRRCSSALLVLWSAASHTPAKASTYRTDETNDETNDGIMTYKEYKLLNSAVDTIKSDTYPDDQFADTCEGYPTPFSELGFITLYGPGAEEPFQPSDGAIFLEILQETLNECTDPCIYVDEVVITEDELQKISVLNLDFDGVSGGGGGVVQGLSSVRDGGLRDLAKVVEEGDGNEDAIEEMEIEATADGHADRQLQRRKRTKKRRIKKAVMRGRKKRTKNKDGRFLQQQEIIEPIIPQDNNCGTILMRKLAATGNPAFTCLFSRGAFITSCDPRAIPLLLEEEELLDRNKRVRNANRGLAEDSGGGDDGGLAMPNINESSVEFVELPNGTYSAAFSAARQQQQVGTGAAEVDSL